MTEYGLCEPVHSARQLVFSLIPAPLCREEPRSLAPPPGSYLSGLGCAHWWGVWSPKEERRQTGSGPLG